MKMTPEARAKLEARAEIEKWWGRWDRLWKRIGIEAHRIVAVRATANDVLERAIYEDMPDAWLLKQRLLALALADYKLRFPTARGDRHFVTRTPPPTSLRGTAATKQFDYCCRYCGRILMTDAPGRQALPPLEQGHVIRCALLMLAGRLTPAPPGFNPADPETLRLAVEQFAAVTKALVEAWASDVVDDTMRRFKLLELD